MELISTVNQILLILTVAGQIIAAVLIVSFLIKQRTILNFFAKYALVFSFIVALVATVGSLFYSEVAGYEPCKLCWFQRILMYPQVIILAMALLKKDNKVASYSIALSFLGVLISGYHYLLQLGVGPSISCSSIGYSINCAQKFVMGFGYITIPMMAFTAFLLIIGFMFALKSNNYFNYENEK
ncbi:MAG: disulfide oxidoreductase [Patescibacteria group bacterium]